MIDVLEIAGALMVGMTSAAVLSLMAPADGAKTRAAARALLVLALGVVASMTTVVVAATNDLMKPDGIQSHAGMWAVVLGGAVPALVLILFGAREGVSASSAVRARLAARGRVRGGCRGCVSATDGSARWSRARGTSTSCARRADAPRRVRAAARRSTPAHRSGRRRTRRRRRRRQPARHVAARGTARTTR